MPEVMVLRVSNLLPQVHVTVVATYSGWMSFFMISLEVAAGSIHIPCDGEPASQRNSVTLVSVPLCPGLVLVFRPCGRGLRHGHQELGVGLVLLEPSEEQFDRPTRVATTATRVATTATRVAATTRTTTPT